MKQVTVLRIEHQFGENVTAHADEAAARHALFDFVKKWWTDDGPVGPIPSDRDKAIDAYFAWNQDEFYSINTVDVES